MNIKVKARLIALALGGFTIAMVGSYANGIHEAKKIDKARIEAMDDFDYQEEKRIVLGYQPEKTSGIKSEVKGIKRLEDPNEYLKDINNIDDIGVAVAIKNTDIMSSKEDGEKLGTFAEGRRFMLLSSDDPEWYTIQYYKNIGYVKKEDCFKSIIPVMTSDMVNKGYLPEGGYVYKTKELGNGDESLDNVVTYLNKLEFVEIYEEYEDSYLVQTTDNIIGYVKKEDVKELEGTLALVDRSTQELRLYEGNEKMVEVQVVTGTRNTGRESDLGLFKFHTKTGAGYIVPGAWVECADYYNRGEAIHTAGWRKSAEFGGDTYVYNGSHGCINTPTEEALYVHNTVKVGDKVLVKE